MMKYTLIPLLLIALLIAAVPAFAISGDDDLDVNNYLRSGGGNALGLRGFSFLDPSRMNFQTSYSMSYATSGGQGLAQGLFMESIGYRLSNPLSLTFNLGFQHTPYSTIGPQGLTKTAQFVGGAALDWHPSNNFFLHFEVARGPSYYGGYGYNPYWNPFPYNSPLQNQNQPGNQVQPNTESPSK